jgi:16S rRNA (guanine(966)-N(2))-methyltransferase RsmD
MRIISGDLKGRKLLSPEGTTTRPMPDSVKVSLFSTLRGHCEDGPVLDAFAGCGALGIEALSRGASHCVFVERDKSSAQTLRRNIETLGLTDRATVVEADALGPGALARAPQPLHLAFFDPPYPLLLEPVGFRRVMTQLAAVIQLLDPKGYAVLRTPRPLRHAVPQTPTAPDPTPKPTPRRSKHKADGRSRWKHERETLGQAPHARRRATDRDAQDDLEDDTLVETLDIAAPESPTYQTPSLHIPGAKGPETHDYRGMSLHYYMKAPT